ncbi:hypothetical protein LIER_06677 [Lithospermum erythrorhizon]|uniref:Uncharacterized protein n=1 Tax=Lithospermum erythrorhizon TaxID=34254 RepID=A0AAV3P5F1_LITER
MIDLDVSNIGRKFVCSSSIISASLEWPYRFAQELVHQAMRRDSADHVTVIVVSLTSSYGDNVPVEDVPAEEAVPQRPRFKFSARSKLRSLLEDN